MNIHVQNNKQVLDLLKCFFILSHKSAQPDPVSWFITQCTFIPHPHQIHYTEQKCNIESERCNHTFQKQKIIY